MRIVPSTPWRACAPLATLLLFLSPSLLTAQTWSQVGERSQGMGGAFVAVADDSSAVYWNPAGLATGSTFDAQVDVATPKSSADAPSPSRRVFVGASMPMLGFAVLPRPLCSPPGRRPRKWGNGRGAGVVAGHAKYRRVSRANGCKDAGYGIKPSLGEWSRIHRLRPRSWRYGVHRGRPRRA
jgi:hypothetical protein